MLIKLTKKAQWDSEVRRAGTIHEVNPRIAEKLIARGIATVKIEEEAPEAEDAPAADE